MRKSFGADGSIDLDAAVDSPDSPTWNDAVQRQHLRRNYAALLLDGGFYAAGSACVAADTVLPTLLKQLGAPTWLVALGPTLGMYGFFVVPFFTSHWVDRLSGYRNFVAWMSVPQRLAPMVAGLALIFFADTHRTAVLWIVALAPVMLGMFGGANVTAFWELVAKVIPARRRASNLSWRNIMGTSLGFAAGGLIAAVLTRWPGPRGFGVLYLCTTGFMMLSFVAFFFIRELPNPPGARRAVPGWREKARMLPQWLREDARLRRYVIARTFASGVTVVTPFLAIHVLRVLGQPESFLGKLVAAQMAGAIGGNLLGAWLGDRFGGRVLAQVGGGAAIALSAGALVNTSEAGFLAMFALLGVATFLTQNGAAILQLELFPAERRPTTIALIALTNLPAMLLCAWLAKELREIDRGIWPAATAALVLLLVSQWFFHRLPEPRRRG